MLGIGSDGDVKVLPPSFNTSPVSSTTSVSWDNPESSVLDTSILISSGGYISNAKVATLKSSLYLNAFIFIVWNNESPFTLSMKFNKSWADKASPSICITSLVISKL